MSQSIKIIFAVAIFISYGLQCYVPVEIIWNTYLVQRLENSEKKLLWEFVTRIGVVIATCKIERIFINFWFQLNFSCFSSACCCHSTPRFIHLIIWSFLLIRPWISLSSDYGTVCPLAKQLRQGKLHSYQRYSSDHFCNYWTSCWYIHKYSRYSL